MNKWFENEDFWISTYPFMFSEAKLSSATEEMDKMLNLVELQGKDVLDLCCGPGRCSLALAKKGYNVVGVDSTNYLLSKAISKSKEKNMDINFIHEDMRNFKKEESFDLILNMFTSFGYFENKNEDILVLENIYKSLKPGGTLFFDVMGKEILAKIYTDTRSTKLQDGSLVIQRPRLIDSWTKVHNEWTIIKDDVAQTFVFEHTIYSAQELIDRMSNVGFKNIKTFGSLDGIPYDPYAVRLIITAQK